MNHHEVMSDEPEQSAFDFDREGAVIESAQCFDDKIRSLNKIVTRRLTSMGDGRYVDDEGWIYEKALPRADKGPTLRFVSTRERYDREGEKRF